jgi:hypothetical protein
VQPPGPTYAFDRPVERVEVWRERVFYDGQRLHRLGSKKIHEVPVAVGD